MCARYNNGIRDETRNAKPFDLHSAMYAAIARARVRDNEFARLFMVNVTRVLCLRGIERSRFPSLSLSILLVKCQSRVDLFASINLKIKQHICLYYL